MKATVDRDTCAGCGDCVEVCPDVFELDSDNIAVAKVDPVPTELEECCRQAAAACPVEAIKIQK